MGRQGGAPGNLRREELVPREVGARERDHWVQGHPGRPVHGLDVAGALRRGPGKKRPPFVGSGCRGSRGGASIRDVPNVTAKKRGREKEPSMDGVTAQAQSGKPILLGLGRGACRDGRGGPVRHDGTVSTVHGQ